MNRGIEEAYVRLEKSFRAIEGYLDNKTIASLFKACRLKPYSIFENIRPWNTRVNRHWIDEYGCSVYIENKKLVVVMNDLSINRQYIRCSDLYAGLNIEQVKCISKLAYVVRGMIAFIGFDDYLRVFVDGRRCSPLIFELDELKLIVASKDMKHTQKIVDAWLIGLPVSKELIESLDDASMLKETLYGNE